MRILESENENSGVRECDFWSQRVRSDEIVS